MRGEAVGENLVADEQHLLRRQPERLDAAVYAARRRLLRVGDDEHAQPLVEQLDALAAVVGHERRLHARLRERGEIILRRLVRLQMLIGRDRVVQIEHDAAVAARRQQERRDCIYVFRHIFGNEQAVLFQIASSALSLQSNG